MIDKNPTNPARYIPSPAYSAMIAALAAAHATGDPMAHIREVVGQYAGVWPEDLLEDREAETSIEERIAATALDIGDLVAADPHYRDPEARLDLVMKIIDSFCTLSPAARQHVANSIKDYHAAQRAVLDQVREHRGT